LIFDGFTPEPTVNVVAVLISIVTLSFISLAQEAKSVDFANDSNLPNTEWVKFPQGSIAVNLKKLEVRAVVPALIFPNLTD
jgi:hypothetical protein